MNAINSLHKAIPDTPAYSETFSLICDQPYEEYWLNKCIKCKNCKGFSEKYTDKLENSQCAQWATWKNDKEKLIKVIEDGSVKELSDHKVSLIPQFLEHCYIKRRQSSSYQKERFNAETKSKDYDPFHALIQVDFSENYTCVSQDEIQSAHWKQSQVSIFTVAIWHSGSLKSYAFVSDNLAHSKDTVVAYIDFALDQLPDIVNSVSIWSDGPCSQFKNRYIFDSIAHLEKRHSVSISWNFFATSHCKGPVDGIGGSVKRFVLGKVKTRHHMVNNAQSFSLAAEEMQHVNAVHMGAP